MGCEESVIKEYNTLENNVGYNNTKPETQIYINGAQNITERYINSLIASSCIEKMEKNFELFKSRNLLGYRKVLDENIYDCKYSYFTYKETHKFASNLSNALLLNDYNLTESKNFEETDYTMRLVGIFGENCPEWAITDIACQKAGVTSVPISQLYGEQTVQRILEETDIQTLFISPSNILYFNTIHNKERFPNLKTIIIFNLTQFFSKDITPEFSELEKSGLQIIFLKQLLEEVSNNKESEPQISNLPKPTDIATICYTPGVDVAAKGVMITHRGLSLQMSFLEDSEVDITENDCLYSFLPLTHIISRSQLYIAINHGITICYASASDVKEVFFEDIQLANPSILFTNPSLLISINRRIFEHFKVFEGNDKSLLEEAFKTKVRLFYEQEKIYHVYYDTHAFRDIKIQFGNRLKVIVSCLAPLPYDTAVNIKVLLTVPIIEAYGMTELSGFALHTRFSDLSNINVGGVYRSLKMKLRSVEELGINVNVTVKGKNFPTGELLFSGPAVFAGYFKNKPATKLVLDDQGWLHSGDIGQMQEINSGIKIVGRTKEIIKLNSGEYLSLVKLETAFVKSPYIHQICIYGNSEKSYIIAIIVINEKEVIKLLKKEGISYDDNLNENSIENFLGEEKILKIFQNEITTISNDKCFLNWERPGKIILTTNEFSTKNKCLSSSLNLVRKEIYSAFSSKLELLYDN